MLRYESPRMWDCDNKCWVQLRVVGQNPRLVAEVAAPDPNQPQRVGAFREEKLAEDKKPAWTTWGKDEKSQYHYTQYVWDQDSKSLFSKEIVEEKSTLAGIGIRERPLYRVFAGTEWKTPSDTKAAEAKFGGLAKPPVNRTPLVAPNQATYRENPLFWQEESKQLDEKLRTLTHPNTMQNYLPVPTQPYPQAFANLVGQSLLNAPVSTGNPGTNESRTVAADSGLPNLLKKSQNHTEYLRALVCLLNNQQMPQGASQEVKGALEICRTIFSENNLQLIREALLPMTSTLGNQAHLSPQQHQQYQQAIANSHQNPNKEPTITQLRVAFRNALLAHTRTVEPAVSLIQRALKPLKPPQLGTAEFTEVEIKQLRQTLAELSQEPLSARAQIIISLITTPVWNRDVHTPLINQKIAIREQELKTLSAELENPDRDALMPLRRLYSTAQYNNLASQAPFTAVVDYEQMFNGMSGIFSSGIADGFFGETQNPDAMIAAVETALQNRTANFNWTSGDADRNNQVKANLTALRAYALNSVMEVPYTRVTDYPTLERLDTKLQTPGQVRGTEFLLMKELQTSAGKYKDQKDLKINWSTPSSATLAATQSLVTTYMAHRLEAYKQARILREALVGNGRYSLSPARTSGDLAAIENARKVLVGEATDLKNPPKSEAVIDALQLVTDDKPIPLARAILPAQVTDLNAFFNTPDFPGPQRRAALREMATQLQILIPNKQAQLQTLIDGMLQGDLGTKVNTLLGLLEGETLSLQKNEEDDETDQAYRGRINALLKCKEAMFALERTKLQKEAKDLIGACIQIGIAITDEKPTVPDRNGLMQIDRGLRVWVTDPPTYLSEQFSEGLRAAELELSTIYTAQIAGIFADQAFFNDKDLQALNLYRNLLRLLQTPASISERSIPQTKANLTHLWGIDAAGVEARIAQIKVRFDTRVAALNQPASASATQAPTSTSTTAASSSVAPVAAAAASASTAASAASTQTAVAATGSALTQAQQLTAANYNYTDLDLTNILRAAGIQQAEWSHNMLWMHADDTKAATMEGGTTPIALRNNYHSYFIEAVPTNFMAGGNGTNPTQNFYLYEKLNYVLTLIRTNQNDQQLQALLQTIQGRCVSIPPNIGGGHWAAETIVDSGGINVDVFNRLAQRIAVVSQDCLNNAYREANYLDYLADAQVVQDLRQLFTNTRIYIDESTHGRVAAADAGNTRTILAPNLNAAFANAQIFHQLRFQQYDATGGTGTGCGPITAMHIITRQRTSGQSAYALPTDAPAATVGQARYTYVHNHTQMLRQQQAALLQGGQLNAQQGVAAAAASQPTASSTHEEPEPSAAVAASATSTSTGTSAAAAAQPVALDSSASSASVRQAENERKASDLASGSSLAASASSAASSAAPRTATALRENNEASSLPRSGYHDSRRRPVNLLAPANFDKIKQMVKELGPGGLGLTITGKTNEGFNLGNRIEVQGDKIIIHGDDPEDFKAALKLAKEFWNGSVKAELESPNAESVLKSAAAEVGVTIESSHVRKDEGSSKSSRRSVNRGSGAQVEPTPAAEPEPAPGSSPGLGASRS